MRLETRPRAWNSTLARGKGLNRVSRKRQMIEAERAALVGHILETRWRCEFPQGCRKMSTDVHEPDTRARGGSILDETNTVALCSFHHRWTHEHPTEATKLGLLIPSWDAS
jgi:hypothetical protein